MAHFLIPDDKYSPSYNCQSWFSVSKFFPEYKQHYDLIVALQTAHDNSSNRDCKFVENFKQVAYQIAQSNNLEWKYI